MTKIQFPFHFWSHLLLSFVPEINPIQFNLLTERRQWQFLFFFPMFCLLTLLVWPFELLISQATTFPIHPADIFPLTYFLFQGVFFYSEQLSPPPREGTPILGHIRDVRPEWVNFPGRKPSDGCKFLTKKLRMGYNSDIILPGNGWFSSKLNKTYCSLVNFFCK